MKFVVEKWGTARQWGHLYGKPGNVGEFDSSQGIDQKSEKCPERGRAMENVLFFLCLFLTSHL